MTRQVLNIESIHSFLDLERLSHYVSCTEDLEKGKMIRPFPESSLLRTEWLRHAFQHHPESLDVAHDFVDDLWRHLFGLVSHIYKGPHHPEMPFMAEVALHTIFNTSSPDSRIPGPLFLRPLMAALTNDLGIDFLITDYSWEGNAAELKYCVSRTQGVTWEESNTDDGRYQLYFVMYSEDYSQITEKLPKVQLFLSGLQEYLERGGQVLDLVPSAGAEFVHTRMRLRTEHCLVFRISSRS